MEKEEEASKKKSFMTWHAARRGATAVYRLCTGDISREGGPTPTPTPGVPRQAGRQAGRQSIERRSTDEKGEKERNIFFFCFSSLPLLTNDPGKNGLSLSLSLPPSLCSILGQFVTGGQETRVNSDFFSPLPPLADPCGPPLPFCSPVTQI